MPLKSKTPFGGKMTPIARKKWGACPVKSEHPIISENWPLIKVLMLPGIGALTHSGAASRGSLTHIIIFNGDHPKMVAPP